MAEEALEVDSSAQKWLGHIAAYEREFKKWEGRAEKIVKRYRDEGRNKTDAVAKFNILWSNVQTLVPATFAKLPVPDVSRRFKDNDPVGRVASLIIERALDFEIQNYADYRSALKSAVYDRFLGGRGTVWVRYEPHIRAIQQGLPEDGDQITEDTDEVENVQEELEYECAPVDYVHWRDFGHTIARTWEEVTAVWRKVYLTRDACIERFGEEVGKSIPLDSRPEDMKKGDSQSDSQYSRALVYEIWDKETEKAYWLSKSFGKIIDAKDNPLQLEGFFPCPRPLFATLTNDSLVPVPDFILYQDQAIELDTLSDRIRGLVEALKVRGVYNSEFPELNRLFTEGENNALIPVKNFAAFAEKQGLKGAIDLVDIVPIANALTAAYQAMDQVKQQIYDITGLADIVRGQSVASETATAQQIKGQYASMRLNSMKHDVAQFATEILQIKAQIMCCHFNADTLMKISAADQLSQTDQQLIPQAIAMLQDNPMRSFRIEIAADSLVQADEQQEKQDRMEFMQAIGGFMKEAVPAASQSPQLAPMLMELFKFGVTGFKVGKGVEGIIDQTMDELRQAAQQQQNQPPQPSPEQMKAQADIQAQQARAQADQQARMAQMQADMSIERQKMEMQMQLEQQKAGIEAQLKAMQAQQDDAFARFEAILKAKTAVEVAEINSGATIQAAQISGAQAATE